MDPALRIALDYWNTEYGYRQINSMFSFKIHQKHGLYRMATWHDQTAEYYSKIIMDHMKPHKDAQRYVYRGDSNPATHINHRREGFISVSKKESIARAFMDTDCCLYTIEISPEVKTIYTGVESEILIEPGCYWINTDPELHRVIIKGPEWHPDIPIPWYGDVIEAQKKEKEPHLELATRILNELIQDTSELGIDVDIDMLITALKDHNIRHAEELAKILLSGSSHK